MLNETNVNREQHIMPTAFSELNKHSAISTNSSIKLYQNASKAHTSQTPSHDVHDFLSEEPISIDTLLIKDEHNDFQNQATDSTIIEIEECTIYKHTNKENVILIDKSSTIPVDIAKIHQSFHIMMKIAKITALP